jgi:hypothetical protein
MFIQSIFVHALKLTIMLLMLCNRALTFSAVVLTENTSVVTSQQGSGDAGRQGYVNSVIPRLPSIQQFP